MTAPADSAILTGLLGDAQIAAAIGDEARLAAMLRVETALARVQARRGVVPAEAAERIAEVLGAGPLGPADLAKGAVLSGAPAPELVKRLRAAVGPPHDAWLHRGATSQDIMDTALVLVLRDALEILSDRLDRLTGLLSAAAQRHAVAPLAGRSWGQVATPTTLGLRIANWMGPLVRCRHRLAELTPRLLVVQLGGAAGTQAALGPDAMALMADLAAELDLGAPSKPWHTERDTIAELGGWLSLVSGACGRIGADLVLMARSEAAELTAGPGGPSSTMPQKANPVLAHALIALARANAGSVGTLHQSLIHTEERDGAPWMLEWLTLPPMLIAAGAALGHAAALAGDLRPDPARMAAGLALAGGSALAEAAAFALAAHMPLPEAQALVKRALATGAPLTHALSRLTAAPVDWAGFADPARHTGTAAAQIAAMRADAQDAVGRPVPGLKDP